jgi:Uma2 family endonuclease
MSIQTTDSSFAHVPFPRVPPLEAGDHLTREEFERRWEAMPGLKNAELIEGVVHMAAAVRAGFHGQPHGRLVFWLGGYEVATPGLQLCDNTSIRLDSTNVPQPDALLRVCDECGGHSSLSSDDYIIGPPELVAEIAASSASYDLHEKKAVYLRHGVREYLVWRVLERQFDWFVLRDGEYASLAAGQDGVLRSEVFPGLWLDSAALLRGDGKTVRRVLEQGLAAPEHAEFVAALAQRRAT